jgi:flagellar basal-body rod protein FlgB
MYVYFFDIRHSGLLGGSEKKVMSPEKTLMLFNFIPITVTGIKRRRTVMFEQSGMMRTNNLLERALDVESSRRRVISNNISNVDVPHFKRSEVNFESELARVIRENEAGNDRCQAIMTDSRHIPFFIERDVTSVRPRVNLDYTTSYRNDGNNVDIEKEIVDAAKNQMRYQAFVTSLSNNYRMMKIAMRSI